MTDEEIAAFLDQLATEDGFREGCVYGRQPCQNGLRVNMLISIGCVEIPGAPIARLYRREGRLDRWWHPGEVQPDLAMLADLMILFAGKHGDVNDAVHPLLAARMVPYSRTRDFSGLLVEAGRVSRDLALREVFKGGSGGAWKLTVARGALARSSVHTAWLSCSVL